MPFLLVKITTTNWMQIKPDSSIMEAKTELQADALNDLRTDENKLQVWYINDDQSNLQLVLAGLNQQDDLLPDYVLIASNSLNSIELEYSTVQPDHSCSIDKLSATKLVDLSNIIYSAIEKL